MCRWGVSCAAFAVLPQGSEDVGGDDFVTARAVAGGCAVACDGEFEGLCGGLFLGALNLGAELWRRERPQCGDALVGVKGDIDAGGTVFVAGVLGEFLPGNGVEAVVEAVEVLGVDLSAIVAIEEPRGVPPNAIRFDTGGIVIVGVAHRFLAHDVVLSGGHGVKGCNAHSLFLGTPE